MPARRSYIAGCFRGKNARSGLFQIILPIKVRYRRAAPYIEEKLGNHVTQPKIQPKMGSGGRFGELRLMQSSFAKRFGIILAGSRLDHGLLIQLDCS